MLKLTRMPVGAQHECFGICVLIVEGCTGRRHDPGRVVPL